MSTLGGTFFNCLQKIRISLNISLIGGENGLDAVIFFRKSLQIRMNFQKRHPVGGENEERDALPARRAEAPACGRRKALWAGAFTRDSAIRVTGAGEALGGGSWGASADRLWDAGASASCVYLDKRFVWVNSAFCSRVEPERGGRMRGNENSRGGAEARRRGGGGTKR